MGMIPVRGPFEISKLGGRSRRMQINTLDHVALWVAERDAIADVADRRSSACT